MIKSIREDVAQQNNQAAKSHRPKVGPKFTNASKLLVTDVDHEIWLYHGNDDAMERKRAMQFVRVQDKTAHICNGRALIRRFCNVPDGLYSIAMDGGLNPLKDKEYVYGYPDIEMLVKHKICSGWYDFNHADLKVHDLLKCVIPNEELRRMVGLVSYIKRLEKKHSVAVNVRIDRDSIGAAINLDSSWRLEDQEDNLVRKDLRSAIIKYDFGLKHPIFMNPNYLEIGLIEMLQYPMVALIRDETDMDEDGFCSKPLVFEYDRGSFFALAPLKR